MKVDFNLEARWELCLGLIKKSSSPPSHRHLSKKYQHTLPIAAKFNLAPHTSQSLMLWRQKNELSMPLIRTQGLLTTDSPKTAIFAQKYAFLGTYRPCWLIWCRVGWCLLYRYSVYRLSIICQSCWVNLQWGDCKSRERLKFHKQNALELFEEVALKSHLWLVRG